MADLGAFGAAKAEVAGEVDTFTLAGETFTARRPLPGLALLEYAAAASADDGSPGHRAAVIGALLTFLQAAVIPGDWPRLRRVALDSGADTDTLIALVRALIAGASARPTRSPSASADGQSNGGTSSKGRPSGPRQRQDIAALPEPA